MEKIDRNWVHWTQVCENGGMNFGQMPRNEVDKKIAEFGVEAYRILRETGADHVLYCIKVFDSPEDDLFSEVRFYEHPMTEAEYEKDVANHGNWIVYAAHALR